MQTNLNIPSSVPEQPGYAAERLNVINGTRAELGGMRDSVTAIGLVEGVLTLPITLIKKMFQPILGQ